MSARKVVKAMNIGQCKTINCQRNIMGKKIAIYKAAKLFGYFIEVEQQNNVLKLRRIS